jgi:hypothetical protein
MLCAGTPLKGRRISTCRSATFHAKTIFLYKTTYLNEPSIVLASFPLVSGSMLSVMVLFMLTTMLLFNHPIQGSPEM